MMTRNDQANLKPPLNNGTRGGSLIIFVTDCLQNLKKNIWKYFYKDPENLFCQNFISLREDYIGTFFS